MDVTSDLKEQLFAAALRAREKSYSPYSGYAVGAALLDERGEIHAGTNVENAAYPNGWCAEVTALSAMLMAGSRRVVVLLVVGSGPEIITPCGGCRQRLSEFASPDLVVIAADPGGVRKDWTLGQLLPFGFGAGHLR